jgi:Putative peptidoglycan binding domain
MFIKKRGQMNFPSLKQVAVTLTISATLIAPRVYAQDDLTSEAEDVIAQIAQAEETIGKYQGGVIREIAQYRLEVLRLNQALLENRILGNEVGIEPELVVPAVDPDPERAAGILLDIQKQQEIIQQAEEEVSQSGGLVQALSLSRLETERLTLAQLRLGWLQAQYGIATPVIAATAIPSTRTSEDYQDAVGAPNAPWGDSDHPEIDYTKEPFPTFANDGYRMQGYFAIQETQAAIDDSPQYTAMNISDYEVSAFSGKRLLILRCVEGEAAVIYTTGEFISTDFRSNSVPIVLRLDKDEAQQQAWNKLTNSQGAGLFGANGERLMRDLYDRGSIFLRAKGERGREYDAQFDLAGVRETVDEIAAACGFSLLALGRDDYRAIQTMLNNAGFDAGTPDGVWGRGSQNAMRAYQLANDLEATGAPDRKTLEAMGINF